MKLNKLEKQILTLEIMRAIHKVFLTTFLIAYFISLSINNIKEYAILNIFTYLASAICSIIVCSIIKKRDKLRMYRFGIFIDLIYLFGIMLLKENIINYCIIFGIIYGASISCYYMPFNYIAANGVRDGIRTKYIGIKNIFVNLINIICPVVIGLLLTYYNYADLTLIFIILTIIQFVFTYFINYYTKSTNGYSLKKYNNVIKEGGLTKYFNRHYLYQLLIGFTVSDGAIKSLVTVFIIMMFKTNLNLGIFTSIFSLITLILSYIFAHKGRRKYFKLYSFISSFFLMASIIIFVLIPNKISFILYSLFFTVGVSIIEMINSINTFDSANIKDIKRNYQIEYLGVRESFLCFGRIISNIILLTVAFNSKIEFMKILLVFMSSMLLLVGFVLNRAKRD